MADNVLKIGALVDVESIGSGMGEAAGIVDSATSRMSLSFKELADSTISSDEAMVAGMAETEGALGVLEERFVHAAETAKLSAAGIGSAFSGIGALLGAGVAASFFLHFIDETQEAVLQMDHLSQRTGFTIETIAGLKYAADTVGISMDALSQGMGRLLRAQELATQGGKGQIQALHDIGLGVSQIKDLAPDQLFFTVGEAIAKATSAADANAAAFALLGRGGAQLIPLFKEYGDQLQVVVDEHGKLSLVTKDAANAALQYKQVTADFSESIRSIMIPVMEGAVVVMKGWQDAWVILKATGEDLFLNLQAGAENLVTALVAVSKANFDILTGQASEAPKVIAAAHAQIAANSDATSKHVEQAWTNAYSRLKAIMAKPIDTPGFTTPPEATKVTGDKDQKALLDQQLKEQLAAIDAEKAAQHLAYAEGKIDVEAWIAAQTEADNQAYAAHEAYFAKLKALYASNPLKLAAAEVEQLEYEYKTAAKTTDELASATDKLNKELRKMGEEAAKTQTKELEAELKATDKAALELAKSLSDLAQSQRELNEAQTKASFTDQEDSIKERMALGTLSEREGANQLKALYREEEQDQLSHLNTMVADEQATADKLRSNLAGDPNNTALKAQLNEAEAQLNDYETKRIAIEQSTATKISRINDQMFAKIHSEYQQITGQINSAVTGWILGQETFAQAVHQVWSKIASDIINYILQIGERWIEEHVIMAAASKLLGMDTDADTKISENHDEAKSYAGLAGAETLAYYAASNPPLAIAMSGLVTTLGLTEASYGKGGIVPHDMPALLHGKEMVLPPALSSFVQSSAAAASGGANSEGGGAGDTYHLHMHMPPITAMDSIDMVSQLKKVAPQMTKTILRSLKGGHGSLKGLL